MKTFSPILFSLLFMAGMPQITSAQTVNSGAWMMGGSAQFSSTKIKNSDGATTVLDLSPNIGLFIIDDLAVGLGISLMSTSAQGHSDSSFGLGPFVRYYVADPFFVQGEVNLGLEDESATTIKISAGYSWFLDNALAIEPALFFSSVNYEGDNLDATIFGLSIGIQAFPGRD